MMASAGPDLDRLVEKKLNGDAKKKTPPYSTSEKAANRLIRRLEMQDMPSTIEEIDGAWFCTFWVLLPNGRERLSTGSGETRALAIARAVMNARLGMGASLSAAANGMSNRIHWAHAAGAPEALRACAECGADLPTRNRETANRVCTVCSWRTVRAGVPNEESRKAEEGAPGKVSRISIVPESTSAGEASSEDPVP